LNPAPPARPRAAAEMKEVAKRRSGSGYAIDRRRENAASVASPTP
jgi:hypothetical protein